MSDETPPAEHGERAAAEVLARVAAVVGPAHARSGRDADRLGETIPSAVACPGSVDEVRALVACAADAGLATAASGFGAHLALGASPACCDLLVRLERMCSPIDHCAADMTASAPAGCSLAELDRALAAEGQWLPIDPPDPLRTSVGGLIAANLSGPLRASQGTVRDLLLGIELVSAEGALVRGGGRVVKNVAGYDLPKLHVGALGSLGLIVGATFKVRPRPPVERALQIDCRSAEAAGELALALREAVEPFWLEIAGQGDADALVLTVGFAGVAEEVADGLERAAHSAAVRGGSSRRIAGAAAVRAELGSLPIRPAAAVLRASTLPTDVGRTLAALIAAAREEGVAIALGAHATSGVVRALISDPDAVAVLVRRLRPRLAAAGGFLVVERAEPIVKRSLVGDADPWGDPGGGLGLMRAVKSALDPHGVFAPGRLPGGI